MSEQNHSREEDRDPRVSRAYRAWSDERTPAGLDRAVLRHAADEAAPPRAARAAWVRPLAFAATLVLGVALIYDMQSRTGPSFGLPERLSGQPAEGDADDAPGAAATAPGADGAQRPEAPAAPPTRYKPSGPRAAKERTLAEEREAVPPSAAATPRAAPEPDRARPLEKRELMVAPAGRPAVRDDARHCTAEQIADAESWRRCIEALREAGDVEAAADESARFEARFPDWHQADGDE